MTWFCPTVKVSYDKNSAQNVPVPARVKSGKITHLFCGVKYRHVRDGAFRVSRELSGEESPDPQGSPCPVSS